MKQIFFGSADSSGLPAHFVYMLFRLWVGLSMAIGHGWAKFEKPEPFISNVENLGIPSPHALAWAAILSELVGGVLIGLGLFTRPAAFFLGCTMIVAAFVSHAGDPIFFDAHQANRELPLIYLACCVLIVTWGPGKFGLDRNFDL